MQVSVENTSELSRKMTVSVSEEVVQEKIAARLKSLTREVKIDGFRPGKAPQQVVQKMYGERVRNEVLGDLIQSTYYDALKSNELNPAGNPYIDSQNDENSAGFSYTAVFEVYPEIRLDGLNELEVVRPVSSVEEIDVDNVIEKLRVQRKTWNTVERAADNSDCITIDFEGLLDDENFTDGKVADYRVEIGAKQMIPGFEDNLIGLAAGDNKTFTLDFPEDYGNEKLAGKTATFIVTASKVEEAVLPEINEEFVKLYGIEDGSIDAFRSDVRSTLERELEQALRSKLKDVVLDALYEKMKLPVPSNLIDAEIENLMKPYKENAKRRNMTLDDAELPRPFFEELAKRRVALSLTLAEIIEQKDIRLDNDKVRLTIEDMAKSYERPQDVIDWYYADNKRLNDVQQMVLENQTVEWLVEQAKVSEETVGFTEIMDSQRRQ